MADPTIQTFCCHIGNGSEMALMVIENFNTDIYNSVCLVSSALGIIGAIFQILPRSQLVDNQRLLSFTSMRGRRIITWLAVADLMAAIGVFIRSTLWISYKNIMPAMDDQTSVLFCALFSAWVQYFYIATWMWTLFYAIDMRFVLAERETPMACYHVSAWFTPAFLTICGLSLLYVPDANCHSPTNLRTVLLRILPNYLATYIPMMVVMIANPWLYVSSSKDMGRIVTATCGQFTRKERDIIESIKVKFGVINVVFYMCWIPNLVNGILLWTLWFHLPVRVIIGIWYLMAVMNPLQAFFNCLVYRRWSKTNDRVVMPWNYWSPHYHEAPTRQQSKSLSLTREEEYPLLQDAPPVSINGSNKYG